MDLDTAAESLGKVGGAADEMGKTLEQSASQRVQAFKNQAIQQLTALGGGIIGIVQGVADNPSVKDFMGSARRALDEKVMPALRAFGGWIQDKVMPVLEKVRADYLEKLRGAFNDLQTKIDENREELTTFGNAIKTVAEWIVENVIPVLYDLYTEYLVGLIDGIGKVVSAIAWWVNHFRMLRDGAGAAIGWVGDKIDWVVDKVTGWKGRISSASRGMWDGVSNSFKGALNWVIGKWNGLSFKIPSVSIPGLGSFGGGQLSMPRIPYLAKGGHIIEDGLAVVGDAGPELVRLGRGASVHPLSHAERNALGGAGGTVSLRGEFVVRGSDLVLVIRDEVQVRSGGDVQAALGT
ncbi:hypothetical protein [Polymorphospora rubra]|uniref:Uncharacterized protein n=1 Tax=Polymorphospora rubra TaxID=338584 RepID=A0A810MSE9_9ACTN|nr:hypothetical protein [Polymorphospora rubra]BCJ64156.1 hypothetical protein Prubr_11770 [Polymorphospora rubra]